MVFRRRARRQPTLFPFPHPQRHTIRDLTTGRVYLIEGGDLPPEEGGAEEEEQQPGSSARPRARSPRVTEVGGAGRAADLTLVEFDRVLGLHTAFEAALRDRAGGGVTPPPGDSPLSVDAAAAAATAAKPSASPLAARARAWASRAFGGVGVARSSGRPRSRSPPPRRRSSDGSPSSASSASWPAAAGPPPPPPGAPGCHVRVSVQRKAHCDLPGLTLVQTLPAHSSAVWAAAFSPCGAYLATAGQDAVVRVWEVDLSRGEGEGAVAEAGAADAPASPAPPPPLLRPRPARSYAGHTQDVLDVAWSASLFLLSASMDKSVRLWHATVAACLRVFRHNDFVTSLSWCPTDDRYFASGSIDGKARVWCIPDGRVAAAADVREMVTAAAFSSDGAALGVGTMRGRVRLFNVGPGLDLEPEACIDVRNARGADARGRKVTCVAWAPTPGGGGRRMLASSNDSRVRLFDGLTCVAKLKGHANRHAQLRAAFDGGGSRVVSGSDDGRVVVWTLPPSLAPAAVDAAATAATGATSPPAHAPGRRDKCASCDSFVADGGVVTVALFGPAAAARAADPAPSPPPPPPSGSLAASLAKGGFAADALARLGGRAAWTRDAAASALAAGEAAMAAAAAPGRKGTLLVVAGGGGDVRVYENLAPPAWV